MRIQTAREARWWQRRCRADDGGARCIWRRGHLAAPHGGGRGGSFWLWQVHYGQFPGWEVESS